MSDENTDTEVEKEAPATETEGDEGGAESQTEGGESEGDESGGEGEAEGGGESESSAEPEVDYKARFEESEKSRNEANEILVRALTHSQHDPRKAAEEEHKKLLAMTPEQRLDYRAQQAEQKINMITAQSEFKIKDANDRADFGIFCAKNPIAAKLSGDVEKRLAEERKRGYNYDRKVLLTYLAGEKALASADKSATKKQRAQASENIKKSGTKATPAGGDKKLNGKRDPNSSEAIRERLSTARF